MAAVRTAIIGGLAAVGVMLNGCGGGDLSASVSGRVLLDDAPLPTGTIMFIPAEHTPGGIAGATVRDGVYAIGKGLRPGSYRVEIRLPRPSTRPIPKPFGKPGEMIESTEEGIDEAFNEKSTLRAVVEKGANTLDFVVTHRR